MSGPAQPRIIVCTLCDPPARIPTNHVDARHDQIEHGLDHHRAYLTGGHHLPLDRWLRICVPARRPLSLTQLLDQGGADVRAV